MGRSQSLIHQVIYSVRCNTCQSILYDEQSQSLIHQVIYSVFILELKERAKALGVSIPYSSGHLFRWMLPYSFCITDPSGLNPLFIRSSIPFCKVRKGLNIQGYVSQSLIHQVIYSVYSFCITDPSADGQGLNPLFIRSSIPLPTPGTRSGPCCGHCLNPLFIRSSIPFLWQCNSYRQCKSLVSIPYSSGHLFRFYSS